MPDLFNPNTSNKKTNIFSLLSKRYPPAEYALMAEVSDMAGHQRSRSADYIAVALWPSRGLAINGIELKSFRSDWLNELKNPAKAENIFQYCDRFWLLTTSESVAKIDEIPISWGWLCIKGNRIVCMKEAPKLTPVPVSRHFMAAMLKRAVDKTNFIHTESIQDRIEEVKQQAIQSCHKDLPHQSIRAIEENKLLHQRIADFESTSGISITASWPHKTTDVGKLVAEILSKPGLQSYKDNIKWVKQRVDAMAKDLSELLKNYPADEK